MSGPILNRNAIELEFKLASEIRIGKDGIGTMSIRGAARVAGVAMQTLQRAFKGDSKNGGKLTELLTQQGFTPTTFSRNGVPDTAVAMIVKYYAYLAGERCNEQSKQMDFVFAAIGSRTWMQQLTGWTAKNHAAKASLTESLMLREAAPWERLISDSFILEACRITGWQWQWRVMGKFLKKHIYDRCGSEIQTYLDEVNPTDDKGTRSSRNHQHFNPEAREMLQEHVKVLETLMSVSINQSMFEKFVEAKFGGTQQMTVFDI